MAPRDRRDPVQDRDLLLEVAVRYAEHGWPVVPLHTPNDHGCSCSRSTQCSSPGKHPRTEHGLGDASTDTSQVRAWWSRWRDANVGVTTGSESGLLVLDVDLPEGPRSLADLEGREGRLRPACEQRTGAGGRQLLFAYPDQRIGNRTRVLPGIDVRGEGGYVVVPPSLHASGERYRWTNRSPVGPAPRWLVTLLARTRSTPAPRRGPALRSDGAGDATTRYASAALQRELAGLAEAVEGTRNDTLNRAAFNLGQLVGAGALDEAQVVTRLEHVAIRIGLEPPEVRRTITSGLTAGVARPRALDRADTPSTLEPAQRSRGPRRR